ncbi:hypothetical protein ANCCAN_08952 [Ancylostoma caninum]|uniref:Uncharacterized protein n=1 Tax=Ancylostoma caninum TaxID=29170 RepID=A0A368GP07_ANCCA|nr:hypothetical protein ANCCAN_08952 [Ancylostoma caninum]
MAPIPNALLLMCIGICLVSAKIDGDATSKILKPWPPENLTPLTTDYDSPSVNPESPGGDAEILPLKRADMFIGRR